MPVLKCPNGKYRIGSGKCIYPTRKKAEKAYAGYRAKSHMEVRIEYICFVVKRLLNLKEKKEE